MFGVVRLNTYVTVSRRGIILNFTLLNSNVTTAVILMRKIRIKNQNITMVEVMIRLMSIRKSNNTI